MLNNMTKKIGQGGSAKVYRADVDNKPYALKVFDIPLKG